MPSPRWLRRVFFTLLVSFLVTTVWLLAQREWRRAKGNRDVAAAVAEIEATDPNWRYDDLSTTRPKPPDDKNGALLVPRIVSLFPGEWSRAGLPANWEPVPAPREANVRFSPSTIREAREKLGTLRAAVALARTFKDRPTGYREIRLNPDVWSTPLQDTSNTRQVLLLLKWDTLLAVEDGDAGSACDAVLAMLNASRSLGEEPFLIAQLLRIATRMIATASLEWLLAQTGPSQVQLAALQAAWADDAEAPLLLYGLRGERAACDVMFRNLAEGVISGDAIKDRAKTDLSFEGFAWWMYRPQLLADRAYYLRWMTRAVQAARKPLHEQAAAIQALPAIDDALHLKLAPLFLPAADKVAGAFHRGTAEARCAVVALACERFRLKHGRWPESLTELCPEFLAAVPLDPFDGEPLRCRRLPDGLVIHSVGRNPPNVTARPGLPEGVDIGFRLWNLEARRQPPPPEPGPDDKNEGDEP